MGRRNLDSVRALDRAFNERRWEDYADLIDEPAALLIGPCGRAIGRRTLLARTKRLCQAVPDARLHIDPYVDLFMSHDGHRTCSIARLTGTPARASSLFPGTFELTIAAVARWRGGKLVEMSNFLMGDHACYMSPGEPSSRKPRTRRTHARES